ERSPISRRVVLDALEFPKTPALSDAVQTVAVVGVDRNLDHASAEVVRSEVAPVRFTDDGLVIVFPFEGRRRRPVVGNRKVISETELSVFNGYLAETHLSGLSCGTD